MPQTDLISKKKSKQSKDKQKHELPKGDAYEEDKDAPFRMISVISYFIVLFIIGIPVWWYTTRVYRASLPLDEMYNVQVPPKTIRENSIPLSLEYDILITIINPDPINLSVDLDGKELDANLQPFLKSVGQIANFTVKSQWLYLENLQIVPTKKDDHYMIEDKRLAYTITPLETKIWSHMSPRPSLNLVVYISRCNMPLYIYKGDRIVDTNSYLSLRWGGVQILNAGDNNCKNKLYKPNIRHVVSIFLHQLKQLLGLKSELPEDVLHLKLTKTKEMIDSTRRTLKSLAQLLSEINSIVISDQVAEKVKLAVKYADLADEYLKRDNFEEALKSAKIAFQNSEKAFSDPSLLALLYFPDDQKYAVYIPLFLPIMIPVLMSITTIRRWYINKNKKPKTD